MSEGHSVLFDQDNYYRAQQSTPTSAQNVEGLDFYQTSYTGSFTDGQYAGQAEFSQTFTESSFVQSAPIAEISWLAAFGTGGLPNEPPLLEELGVNFQHIKSKTLAVLNPFRRIDTQIYEDADITGPLIFIILLGVFMLLKGKIQFGHIYGISLMGWLGIYALLNLMSENGVDIARTASILGYCLLPIVILGGINLFMSFGGPLKIIIAMFPITWSTYSSATMFVTVLSMTDQRLLIAYPISIFYTSFAMMTVF